MRRPEARRRPADMPGKSSKKKGFATVREGAGRGSFFLDAFGLTVVKGCNAEPYRAMCRLTLRRACVGEEYG